MAKNGNGKTQSKDKFSQNANAKVVTITKMGQEPGKRYGTDPHKRTKG